MDRKKVMKTKAHIYYTIFISFLSVLLNCFINLYLTPKITNDVGVEAYGFVSLAKNFVSYANIVMTALNSYAARYMSIAYMRGDYEEYRKYYNTVFWSDLIIGGFIFIVGLICTFNISSLLNVPINIVSDIKILFVLTFAAFYITTLTTVFYATGYVKDRLDLVNGIKGISYIVEIALLMFTFFVLSPKVFYVGLATCISAIFVFVGTFYITNKLIPGNQIRLAFFDRESLKKLVIGGIWNSANSMGNALNSGLDLLVSNLLLNALAMGQVSIAKTIGNLIYTLYATISQPFHPTFLKKYSKGDIGGLLSELKYSMKVCGFFTNLVFAGFCVLGLQFYRLWIPSQDIMIIYKLTIIAMLPCITEGCMYPIYYIYTLTVKNRYPCIVTIIGGILNVLGMVICLKFTNIGVYSIVITTAIVMSFINLVSNPLYMAHCLKVKKTTFYPSIAHNVFCCLVAIIAMKLVSLTFTTEVEWGSFAIRVIVCAAIGGIAQMIVVFKPSELKMVFKKISNKLYNR